MFLHFGPRIESMREHSDYEEQIENIVFLNKANVTHLIKLGKCVADNLQNCDWVR